MTNLKGAARFSNSGVPPVEAVIAVLRPIVAAASAKFAAVDRIDENASLLEEGLGLDSVMIVEVIAGIEQRLDFQFADDDLATRSFASLRTLANVIVARLHDPIDD